MKKSFQDCITEVDDFFSSTPNINEKAWDIIHDFYHEILTYMDKQGITKAELARKLGKSRASISQMFNKNPNVSIKKLVEIADAIGIKFELKLINNKIEYEQKTFESDTDKLLNAKKEIC